MSCIREIAFSSYRPIFYLHHLASPMRLLLVSHLAVAQTSDSTFLKRG
jgi:hypothetical protein